MGNVGQDDYYYDAAEHPMGGVYSLSAASWYRFESHMAVEARAAAAAAQATPAG